MIALSLRGRLTLWYVVVLLAVLGAFGAAVPWMIGRFGEQRIDGELADLDVTVSRIVTHESGEGASPASAADEATETVADPALVVAVLGVDRTVLAVRPPGADVAALIPADTPARANRTVKSGSWRVSLRPMTVGNGSLSILVARPLDDVRREQREVWQALIVGIPLALLLAGAGGWWLASIGLAPVGQMARRAMRLSLSGSDDLGEPRRRDELGELTLAFNGLVERLRAALQTQRQFMADASHELRTPVSIIRSAADVTLSRTDREAEEYRETLSITADQARRLGRLVEDMLVLARADGGGYPVRPVTLDLAELVDDSRRALKVLAAERGVQIRSSAGPEIPVCGDEDLLRRLVSNLLQNAVQHTPPGGQVTVTLTADAEAVSIRVIDEGPGVPESDRVRIFDRFVRLDAARSTTGTGLGLPIARWIVEAHHGTLVLESSGASGSTFRATLPAGPASHTA